MVIFLGHIARMVGNLILLFIFILFYFAVTFYFISPHTELCFNFHQLGVDQQLHHTGLSSILLYLEK